jgi:hypothetical protein
MEHQQYIPGEEKILVGIILVVLRLPLEQRFSFCVASLSLCVCARVRTYGLRRALLSRLVGGKLLAAVSYVHGGSTFIYIYL